MRLSQTGIVTAILREIGKQIPEDTEVLPRQLNAIISAADDIVREFARGEIMSTPGQGIAAWRKTDQVGASSDFMAARLGHAGRRDYAYPRDPADFNRCLTLLEAAPELRENLKDMANEGPEWAALVAHWDDLERLWQEESPTGQCPKLHELMQSLYQD